MQGLNPLTMQCTYETPCGWCTKWDKKCDKKIGCGHNGDVGQRGMIGVCPNCGRSGCLSWNPDTDVSSCSCGWNNDKPKRGLRVESVLLDGTIPMPGLTAMLKGERYNDTVKIHFEGENNQ